MNPEESEPTNPKHASPDQKTQSLFDDFERIQSQNVEENDEMVGERVSGAGNNRVMEEIIGRFRQQE